MSADHSLFKLIINSMYVYVMAVFGHKSQLDAFIQFAQILLDVLNIFIWSFPVKLYLNQLAAFRSKSLNWHNEKLKTSLRSCALMCFQKNWCVSRKKKHVDFTTNQNFARMQHCHWTECGWTCFINRTPTALSGFNSLRPSDASMRQ